MLPGGKPQKRLPLCHGKAEVQHHPALAQLGLCHQHPHAHGQQALHHMADGRQLHFRQLPGRPRLHPGRLCGLRLRGSLLRGGLRVGQAVDVIGIVLTDAGRERLLSDLLVLVGHTVLPAPELELQPVPEPQFPGPLLHQMIPLVLVRRQAPEGKPEGQPGKELFLGVGLVQPPQEIVLVRRAELFCLPPVPHCFLHFVHGNTSFFCITQRCFVVQSVTPFGCVVNEYVPAIFRAKNAKKEGENKKSPRSPERRAGNLSFYPACRASFFASR